MGTKNIPAFDEKKSLFLTCGGDTVYAVHETRKYLFNVNIQDFEDLGIIAGFTGRRNILSYNSIPGAFLTISC